MNKNVSLFIYFFIIFIPTTKAAVPGTFFWKPRLGLSMKVPQSEFPRSIMKPTAENVRSGKVVLIRGYQAGITVIALAAGINMARKYNHHDPTSSYFYNNAYRWTLRHLDLLPDWLGGTGGHYVNTHKVWKRRFYYMNKFVPQWLKTLLFFVDKDEWEQEEKEFKEYSKWVEASFGKYYRYPSKKFQNYKSYVPQETVENLDSISIVL